MSGAPKKPRQQRFDGDSVEKGSPEKVVSPYFPFRLKACGGKGEYRFSGSCEEKLILRPLDLHTE